jgi:hypothetical protein
VAPEKAETRRSCAIDLRVRSVEGERLRTQGSDRTQGGGRALRGGMVNHLAGGGAGRTRPEETGGAAATWGAFKSACMRGEEREVRGERVGRSGLTRT